MTKHEICSALRKRCWYRRNWLWFNSAHPIGKKGVSLREAASLERMTSSESLTENSALLRGRPTDSQFRAELAKQVVKRFMFHFAACSKCMWPVWKGENCDRCGTRNTQPIPPDFENEKNKRN